MRSQVVNFKAPKIDFKKVNKGKAIPDQSLSIAEIVRRYVRGIPVDVVKRDAVYVDQADLDLEAVSRMDFAEKASLASRIAAETAAAERMANERERARRAKAKEPDVDKSQPSPPPVPANEPEA